MAITFHQQPATYSPSDNPLVFVFSSNQTAQPNFFFRIRTKYNGNQVSVDDVFPQVGSRAMFDASNIMKQLAIQPELKNQVFWSRNLERLNIEVIEFYGTTPVAQASLESDTIRFWKSSVSEYRFTKGFADYVTGERLALTRMPRGKRHKLIKGQDTGVSYITRGLTGCQGLKVFNAVGDVIGVVNVNCAFNNVFTYATGQAPTLADFATQIGLTLINGAKFGDTIVFDNVGYELFGGEFSGVLNLTGFLKCSALIIGVDVFNQNTLEKVFLPICQSVSGTTFQDNSITHFYAPELQFILENSNFSQNNIQYFNAPVLQQIGFTTADNDVFLDTTGNNITVILPAIHQTSNAGGLEGDLDYLDDNNTVTFDWDGQEFPDWISEEKEFTVVNLNSALIATAAGVSEDDIAFVEVVIDGAETLTFEYWSGCGEAHELVWMNDLGGFDCFLFEHNKRLSGEAQGFEYIKPFGQWANQLWSFNLQDAGIKTMFTKQTDKGLIATDYITQEDQNFLVETFKSPFHLLYGTNADPLPIVPTQRRFEFEQRRFEELISTEIVFDFCNQNYGLTL
jgi:hypothetical protein